MTVLTYDFLLIHIHAELGPGLHVGPEVGLEHVPDRLIARHHGPGHGEAGAGDGGAQASEVLHDGDTR